jgi:hypothetical protein
MVIYLNDCPLAEHGERDPLVSVPIGLCGPPTLLSIRALITVGLLVFTLVLCGDLSSCTHGQ